MSSSYWAGALHLALRCENCEWQGRVRWPLCACACACVCVCVCLKWRCPCARSPDVPFRLSLVGKVKSFRFPLSSNHTPFLRRPSYLGEHPLHQNFGACLGMLTPLMGQRHSHPWEPQIIIWMTAISRPLSKETSRSPNRIPTIIRVEWTAFICC